MAILKIQTPRGTIVNKATKTGKVKAELTWNAEFGAKHTTNFNNSQKFVDSEVLRMCVPYMPMQSTMLIKSGTLGTVIGNGEVEWVSPYAAMQYYETAETRDYDTQRGSKWFERMKADHKDQILNGAKKIAGGNK